MREEDLEIAVKVRNNFIFYFFFYFFLLFFIFIPGFGEAISVLYPFWRVCVDCIFA